MNTASPLIDNLSIYSPSHSVISLANQSVMLLRSFFPATEGEVQEGNYLKIGLCMSAGGKVRYQRSGESVIKEWKRGELYFNGPNNRGEFASPDVDMVGLAIDLDRFSAPDLDLLPLLPLENRVLSDHLISSVLLALWNSADAYGGSSAFIEHGVELILRRLLEPLRGTERPRGVTRALSPRQFEELNQYIELRVAEDIRVPDLAQHLGMESRAFSNALKMSCGHAPYSYITTRRMEVAKKHLATGKSVTETALSVGYYNPGKFAAAFRRLVGCTPSNWNQNRN